LIVTERHWKSQFLLRRLLVAFVLLGLAAASPSFVHLRFDYMSELWAILTAVLLCTLVGAAIGVLIAGGRGAIGGALTAITLLIIATGILFIAAILIVRH
jgi:mannitol-specific phosphotransferase system IIBC component